MRELTPLRELEESVYPFKGSDRRLGLLRNGSSRLAVPKPERREHTGLGSNSQGWLGDVYLESELARLIYRSLCKTQQQALNRTAKTVLD
jgi:hypothetical protein